MTRLEKCELAKERGFRYDSETGNIYGIKKRLPLNNVTKNGYIMLNVSQTTKSQLFGHHFAWYMSYGNVDFQMLDHINENKIDNRISNLRISDYTLNNRNVKTTAKGYCWDSNKGKWLATIGINYKQIYLGLFNTEQEAREAYINAKKKYHNI